MISKLLQYIEWDDVALAAGLALAALLILGPVVTALR